MLSDMNKIFIFMYFILFFNPITFAKNLKM